jgi:hypothetical protein
MNQVCTPDLSHLRGSPHVDVHVHVHVNVDVDESVYCWRGSPQTWAAFRVIKGFSPQRIPCKTGYFVLDYDSLSLIFYFVLKVRSS